MHFDVDGRGKPIFFFGGGGESTCAIVSSPKDTEKALKHYPFKNIAVWDNNSNKAASNKNLKDVWLALLNNYFQECYN